MVSDIKWIKVAVDMFEDSKIDFIRSLPEGDSIIVTWIQMLSIAGKSNANGYLMVTDGIPYSEQLLCNKLRRNPVFMQFAVQTLVQLKMINVEDGPFHITKWEKHQSVDKMEDIKSKGAIRQKNYRERNKDKSKSLLDGVTRDVTSDVTESERITSRNALDIDKDLELEKQSYIHDRIPELIQKYSVECKGTFQLEEVMSYIGVVSDEQLEESIKRSEGKNVGYMKTILKDMMKNPEKYEKASASGKSTVGRTQMASFRREEKREKEVPMYVGPISGDDGN